MMGTCDYTIDMNGFRRSPGPSRVSVSRRREARQAAGSRGCRLLGPSGGPFNPARGAKRYSGEAAACRLRPPPALNSLPPLVLYEPIMQEPGRSVHRASVHRVLGLFIGLSDSERRA